MDQSAAKVLPAQSVPNYLFLSHPELMHMTVIVLIARTPF
jgi:hypothetical protein